MLLKRRNRLRRQGRHYESNVVAQKINNLFTTNRSSDLNTLSSASTKEMWAAVNKTRSSANFLLQPFCGTRMSSIVILLKLHLKIPMTIQNLMAFDECNSENFDPLSNVAVEALLGIPITNLKLKIITLFVTMFVIYKLGTLTRSKIA